MVLAGGVRRADELITKTEIQCKPRRRFPGVLGVALVLEEMEVAEREDIGLAYGGVVAEKRVADAGVAVVGVLIAGPEIEVRGSRSRCLPGRFH